MPPSVQDPETSATDYWSYQHPVDVGIESMRRQIARTPTEPVSWWDQLAAIADASSLALPGRGGFVAPFVVGKLPKNVQNLPLDVARKIASKETAQARRIFQDKPAIGSTDDRYLESVLRSSLWHGTHALPERIYREGYRPQTTILGEASGVSVTPRFDVAAGFGDNRIRNVTNLRPEQILRTYRPEEQELYQQLLSQALGKVGFDALRDWSAWTSTKAIKPIDLAKLARYTATSGDIEDVAKTLQASLQERGFGGVLYPPQRYNEFELRILDPKSLLPLENRALYRETEAMNRYINQAQPIYDAIAASHRGQPGYGIGIQELLGRALQDLFASRSGKP